MPVRATKRGDERTPLSGHCDVLVCGASFAGLAVARELAGAKRPDGRAQVLVHRPLRDRRAPDLGLRHPHLVAVRHGPRGLAAADLPRARGPHALRHDRAGRCPGASPPSTTGRSAGCCGSRAAASSSSRPRRWTAAPGDAVHTDRGDLTAAADRRRAGLAPRTWAARRNVQPPDAFLSRGLEVHPHGQRRRHGAVARPQVRARRATAWSFPADGELRVGVGLVRPAVPRQGADRRSSPRTSRSRPCSTRATGSRTRSARRPRTASSSSATRPATACRPPPRGSAPRCTSGSPAAASCARCVEGRRSRAGAAALLREVLARARMEVQLDARRPAARPEDAAAARPRGRSSLFRSRTITRWVFERYLNIAPPEFASLPRVHPAPEPERETAGAAAA